jgi:hypothetical protein
MTQSEQDSKERKYWERSPQCQQVRSTLISTGIIDEIDNGVAFGCNTITWLEGEGRVWAMTQHALMLSVRNTVLAGSEDRREVECFAQDPLYVQVDVQGLRKVVVTVLEDPRASLEVGDTSAIISIEPGFPLEDVIVDIARPAVMILVALNL